jgi:hypothetical protein
MKLVNSSRTFYEETTVAVTIFWRETESTDLILEDVDGVDVGPGGDLRLYKRGTPDIQLGAIASGLWKYYILQVDTTGD